MHDNLDDEQNEQLKTEDKKSRKAKLNNLNVCEKEKLKNTRRK